MIFNLHVTVVPVSLLLICTAYLLKFYRLSITDQNIALLIIDSFSIQLWQKSVKADVNTLSCLYRIFVFSAINSTVLLLLIYKGISNWSKSINSWSILSCLRFWLHNYALCSLFLIERKNIVWFITNFGTFSPL